MKSLETVQQVQCELLLVSAFRGLLVTKLPTSFFNKKLRRCCESSVFSINFIDFVHIFFIFPTKLKSLPINQTL